MLQSGYMIRRLTPQDLDELMVIEHQSFSLPWSRESYEAELNNEWATYLACDCEGELAAYVGMWTLFEEAHITNLAVAKKFRGRGLGRALMHQEIKVARDKQAERILLEVRPSNVFALAMYETMGFVPTGRRKEYYSDNQEDAIVMTKFLNWRNRVLHGREQKGNG